MKCETIVTGIGLVMNIIGVGILFVTTSSRKLEAELAFNLVKDCTNEGEEWLQPYSFEEHKRSLAIAEQRIRHNYRWQWSGLGLVILGVILQGLGLFL